MKDPAHKAVLFEYEAAIVQDGLLEPLDLTPKSPLKAIKNLAGPDKEPTLSDSDAEADDEKEFCRNTNKYADLKFNVWARAFKQSEPSIFTKTNVKPCRKEVNVRRV